MRFLKKIRVANRIGLHLAFLKSYIRDKTAANQNDQRKKQKLMDVRYRLDVSDKPDIMYSFRDTADEPDIKLSRRDTSDYQRWEKTQKSYVSFSAMIRSSIEKRQLTNREFYRRAGIDRKLFSRLYNDFSYQPSRNTAIRCCLALHLDEKGAEELMKCAGFAFSDNNPSDLVIRYCLIHRLYDIDEANYLLYAMELPVL